MSGYGEELYGGGLYGGPASAEEVAVDETWTVIGGAVADTVAGGPSYYTDPDGLPILAPGVTVGPLTLELIDRSAMGFVISALPESFSRSFQDDANDTGTGSFAIDNTDIDISEVLLERLVNYKVYGNKALTMLIESMHKVDVAEGEEYDQITICTGRGHLALWEEFVLYPSRGTDSQPVEEDRVFNWTSPTYYDVGWKYAKPISRYGSSPYYHKADGHAPFEWPDHGAYWIWAKGTTSWWAPPGVCYFRKTFTVPSGVTQIAIYYSMDNRGKIYVDGIPFAEQDRGGPELYNTKYVVVDVTPGPHLIAAEVFNEPRRGSSPETTPVTYTVVAGDTLWGIAQKFYGSGAQWRVIYDKNKTQIQADATTAGLWDPYDPGHWIFPGQVFTIPGLTHTSGGRPNPGGLIMAVYESDDEPTNLLLHTNHTWRIVAYPEEPPGMSVGEVIRRVKTEASRRGNDLADDLTLKFTDKVDSAGKPWPVVADIASKVGTDYLTFLLELTAKYVDIWMAPGTLNLYAWNKGTRSKVRNVTLHPPTDTSDPNTGNMFELTHTVLV